MKSKGGLSPSCFPTPDEIADPEAPFWVREASRTTRKAGDIAATAHPLQPDIRAYRRAISLTRDQRCEADPEMPF